MVCLVYSFCRSPWLDLTSGILSKHYEFARIIPIRFTYKTPTVKSQLSKAEKHPGATANEAFSGLFDICATLAHLF